MRALGLIAEYNPFHNGHLYHLEQSKKTTNRDFVVCVMSGNFIQRGEPALVNKWARAKMALNAGVDLVLELPTIFSISSAEYFSYGAIKILDSIGIVDSICFGSESGNIENMGLIADVLCDEPLEYKNILKKHLLKGVSFASARENALLEYFETLNTNSEISHSNELNISEILNSSNNILAIEYLKALKKLQSNIRPYTIKRIKNQYNQETLTDNISSASSIRKCIENNVHLDDISFAIPKLTQSVLKSEFEYGRGPVFKENFEHTILSLLRKIKTVELGKSAYICEGLENRIKKFSMLSGTLNELIENVATKRYPKTRIQRILFNMLLGLTSEELSEFMNFGGPQYTKVLAFNQNGQKLLSHIKQNSRFPVITKPSAFRNSCNTLLKKMLEFDCISTDIYVLGYNSSKYKYGGQEFTQNVQKNY